MERLQSSSEMYMDLMNLVVEQEKCDQVPATYTDTATAQCVSSP